MTKSTDEFLSLNQDSRIRYEDGALKFASEIAPYLDTAINTIETKQGKFKKPVVIYVTKSIDSFSSFCTSNRPVACVIGSRLFVSPKLLNEKERLPRILTHELSHLQLTQSIGRWNYQTLLPTWFKEGLAVYVSNGGGAEGVSEREAYEAIKQGKTIEPNGSGNLLFQKTASSFGLKTHMFYRQSEMFVKWLHDKNLASYSRLFAVLNSGKTLDEALLSVYGFDIQQAWNEFLGKIKHNKSVNSDWKKCCSLSVAVLLPVSYANC